MFDTFINLYNIVSEILKNIEYVEIESSSTVIAILAVLAAIGGFLYRIDDKVPEKTQVLLTCMWVTGIGTLLTTILIMIRIVGYQDPPLEIASKLDTYVISLLLFSLIFFIITLGFFLFFGVVSEESEEVVEGVSMFSDSLNQLKRDLDSVYTSIENTEKSIKELKEKFEKLNNCLE